MKDWLGIGSPSKYMRDEVGQWIPEGLAVGIDRHMGAVTSAGEQMVNALTESTTMDSMIAAGIDAAERFANGVRDVDMPTLTPKVGDPEYRPSGGFGYGPGDGGGSGLGGGSQVVFEAGAIVVQTPAKDPLIVAEQVADVIAERQAEKAY